MSISDPSGRGSWLEPNVRCEESGSSPLDRKSYAVFYRPVCLGEPQGTTVVLRTAVWHGAKDKITCRTQELDFPTVQIDFHMFNDTEMPSLDEALRDLDASLSAFVPDVEKLAQDIQSKSNANVQQEKASSGKVRHLRVYRRFRFSSCNFGWQEDLNTPTIMGTTYARFTTPLVELAVPPSKSANSEWLERYDIHPNEYIQHLESQKRQDD